jgi:hypothetical protein
MTPSSTPPAPAARNSMGRQMAVVSLPSLLFLAVGVWLGQWMIRGQLQIQQLLVTQLQQEIRGLTGDIQRLELGSSRAARDVTGTLHRLDEQQRVHLQAAVHRTESLERSLRRELEQAQGTQASGLEEFASYRRRKLSVPVEEIDRAVARWVGERVARIEELPDLVQGHLDEDHQRLTAFVPTVTPERDTDVVQTASLLPSPFGSTPADERSHVVRRVGLVPPPLVIAAPTSPPDSPEFAESMGDRAADLFFAEGNRDELRETNQSADPACEPSAEACRLEPIADGEVPQSRRKTIAAAPRRAGLTFFTPTRPVDPPGPAPTAVLETAVDLLAPSVQ